MIENTAQPSPSARLQFSPSINNEAEDVRKLASEEARLNRSELEKLYADSSEVVGEFRYHLLWRLSQLERMCLCLERCCIWLNDSEEDIRSTRELVSKLALQAVQLRQEARLLLNAYEKPARSEYPDTTRRSGRATRRERSSTSSERRTASASRTLA